MKKDLKEAILGIEVTQFDGQKADLEELVNPKQLEKVISDWMPEVLSQEWIDSHTDVVENNFTDEVYLGVRRNDLQNLLVPKQPFGNSEELPVIPKYIADWIEGCNWNLEKWKLPSTFRSNIKYKADQRLYEWANKKGNMDIFMKAILFGYEVEEEPKYRVIDNTDVHLLCKFKGEVITVAEFIEFSDVSDVLKSEQYNLTEQEIKDYDERFWPFAVKVEELEE